MRLGAHSASRFFGGVLCHKIRNSLEQRFFRDKLRGGSEFLPLGLAPGIVGSPPSLQDQQGVGLRVQVPYQRIPRARDRLKDK